VADVCLKQEVVDAGSLAKPFGQGELKAALDKALLRPACTP
jgi:hypothetical protein